MPIGNGCLYEYSVDRFFEILSEGRLPSASAAMLEILDVCRTCDERECPGIAKMMTESASTELAYKTIGPVVSYPPDYSPHLVVAPYYAAKRAANGGAEAMVAEVAE